MKNKQEKDFEALSGAAQILARPGMWLGSMQPLTQKLFMIDKDGVEYKEIEYIPAFRKIIDEILDNSVDSLVKYNGAKGKVKVVIDEGWVYIEDNGPGIPVIRKDIKDITDNRMSDEEKKKISETYLPEIAWTRLFSGSNFKDSDDKTTVGSHGLGSKCTSIFSKKFVGISDDGKKLCKVVAKNNLETVETEVSESKERGVRIKFVPDFARFKMDKIGPVYVELMRQRLMCLGITFPGIKFSLNGKQVNVNDKAFLNLFHKHITFQVFDRGFIGVYPNESDEFNFFTYVDGLALNRGGNHIDYIVDKLVTPVREKLVKKFKNIKPADIKNKLSLVVFLRDFPNLKFDSQTKETLTNLPSEITKYFGESVDWEKLAKNILKNEYILDPIVETFKLKEEVKERVALKQAGKSKVKISVDKYHSPIGTPTYLFVCEGLSARGGIAAALGRKDETTGKGNGFAYYASRGVGINAYDATSAQLLKNQEFSDIITILGLDITNPKEQALNFKKFVITSDQDADGIHISSIYLGWFMKFAPWMFDSGIVCRLNTPLAIVFKDKAMTKVHKMFFDLATFKKFEGENDMSKFAVQYYKGLGSFPKEMFIKLFKENGGVEQFIQTFKLDESGKVYIDSWLNGDKADERKRLISDYTFDIDMV